MKEVLGKASAIISIKQPVGAALQEGRLNQLRLRNSVEESASSQIFQQLGGKIIEVVQFT